MSLFNTSTATNTKLNGGKRESNAPVKPAALGLSGFLFAKLIANKAK